MPSRSLAVLLLSGLLLAAPAARADNGGAAPPGATTPKSTGSGGAPPVAIPKPAPKQKAHRGAAGKGKRPVAKAKRKAKHHKPAPTTTPAPAGVFPVAGPHDFGGPEARFGAGRAGHIHQGQDVIAAERTPIVSPTAGTVVWRANQPGGAGRYLVIRSVDGHDYVFMHLRPGTVLVARGDTVRAGQQIAQVGHTGDASGPHLHFEVWVGGWQAAGGRPIDPLPFLRQWDATG